MFLKNSWEINSLKPLSRYLDCRVNVDRITLGGKRFWIIPFVHHESEYMDILKKVEKRYEDGDILLTHIGVRSAKLNMCFLLQSWSVVDFSNSPFDIVYTGHFHCMQQVGRNVWYPGSPIPFKFDEGDVDHGFFIFDTKTSTHEFVSIWEGTDEGPPQFLTLDDESIQAKTEEEIRNNIVRVALSRDYTHNQLFEMRQHLLDLGANRVRWMHLASKEEKEGIDEAKRIAANAPELFERYIESDKSIGKDYSKQLLIKLNKDIVIEGDRRYEIADL